MAPQPVFTRSEPSSHAGYIGKPIWLMKCYEKAWKGTIWQKVYHISKVVVSYVIPLLIMAVAYARVCLRLWSGIPTDESHRPALGGRSAGQTKPTMNKSTETQLESRRKVARMLIVVVVMFAICKLPTHVLNTIRYMDGFNNMKASENTESSGRVALHVSFLIAHFMAYLNNVINPVIYNFLSARFRKEFRHVFSCCPCVTAPDREGKRPDSTSYHRCRDFAARSSNNGVTSQSDFRSHDHNTEYLQLSKLGKSSGTNNNSNIVINTKPLAPNPES
ncbi:orexin receptor type 2-like [Asterias rubens]|uniref:orexin receptor type 2-like n=1 Tax=Asterias rubens TaxID=7604 RepID=UPI001455D73A|nr:orexin receptor type 2-like [Asterias rubens]